MSRRLQRNLVTAALVAGGLCAAFAIAGKENAVEGVSFATAYVGAALLAVTLCLGPLNLMRGVPNPVSTHIRRDAGIWAATTGIAHTLFGLQVHMGGRLSAYFVLPRFDGGSRLDASTIFVTANYMGALGTILLIFLLALSSDFALRRAGTRRWKSLQRSSYWLAIVVAVHGGLYQALEKRPIGAMAVFGMLIVAVIFFQLRGVVIFRRRADGGRGPMT